MRKSKYRNVPVVVDGVRFASKAEAKRDAELQLLVKAGKIRNLQRQPRFPLEVNDVLVCTYVADWRYEEITKYRVPGHPDELEQLDADVVEDRKGALTKDFKIKFKLAKALHPEIEWRLS